MSHVRVQLPVGGIDLRQVERQAVIEALNIAKWEKPEAAKLLRISSKQLDYKMIAHKIALPADIERAVKIYGQPLGESRLNEESTRFAWLYQHAETDARLQLFDAIRRNGCKCTRCTGIGCTGVGCW